MKLLPMGPAAVLVESPAPDPMTWSLQVRQLALPGVVDVVPAAATVLIRCESARSLATAIQAFGRVAEMDAAPTGPRDEVEIPAIYDGPDLDEVADATGLTLDDVVALHSGADYEVAFCGFAPGFAYLRGLPRRLHLPRRATPRTRVAAGSVAIAAEYSAVYPGDSPGGWHLLGATTMPLFDPTAEPPARLQPGTRVRFRPR